MQALISIDPGNHVGWSVISIEQSPKLMRWGLFDLQNKDHSKPWNPSCPSFLIRWIVKTFEHKGVEIKRVVIEDQYVGEDEALAIRLAHFAGRWQEAASANSLDYVMIEPERWQSQVLFNGNFDNKVCRNLRKEEAVKFCQAKWGQTLIADTADSVVQGYYVVTILNRALARRRNRQIGTQQDEKCSLST